VPCKTTLHLYLRTSRWKLPWHAVLAHVTNKLLVSCCPNGTPLNTIGVFLYSHATSNQISSGVTYENTWENTVSSKKGEEILTLKINSSRTIFCRPHLTFSINFSIAWHCYCSHISDMPLVIYIVECRMNHTSLIFRTHASSPSSARGKTLGISFILFFPLCVC
jgi:hypothetical protein